MDILPRKPCKGVSRQDFFQDLKATRPQKERTNDIMPLALGHAGPCYPHTIAILRCCPGYHIVEQFAPFNVTK